MAAETIALISSVILVVILNVLLQNSAGASLYVKLGLPLVIGGCVEDMRGAGRHQPMT
jgi:hypothetical protein